ncbi:MAG: DUF433 domain-containing protein [Myxococcales bacterium]|nr:DUF433 domain-containing protein [Polyangiaceae bacterium]MDW8248809.1 DUF433 domain-containing protein [Myxococcales bacterium]
MSLQKAWIWHRHVRIDPEVLGGSPYVEGSRVPVRRLWAWHRSGVGIEALMRRYPQLGPARVLAALAFAYDNQEQIEEDLARERELLGQTVGPRRAERVIPEQQRLFADLPEPPPSAGRRR